MLKVLEINKENIEKEITNYKCSDDIYKEKFGT